MDIQYVANKVVISKCFSNVCEYVAETLKDSVLKNVVCVEVIMPNIDTLYTMKQYFAIPNYNLNKLINYISIWSVTMHLYIV